MNEPVGCWKCRHLRRDVAVYNRETGKYDTVICQRTEWKGEGAPQYNRGGWKIGDGWKVITHSLAGIDWMKNRPDWCQGKEELKAYGERRRMECSHNEDARNVEKSERSLDEMMEIIKKYPIKPSNCNFTPHCNGKMRICGGEDDHVSWSLRGLLLLG
jgi:hypothetical protein